MRRRGREEEWNRGKYREEEEGERVGELREERRSGGRNEGNGMRLWWEKGGGGKLSIDGVTWRKEEGSERI